MYTLSSAARRACGVGDGEQRRHRFATAFRKLLHPPLSSSLKGTHGDFLLDCRASQGQQIQSQTSIKGSASARTHSGPRRWGAAPQPRSPYRS